MLPCLAFPHPSPFRLLVPESEDRPYLAQLDLPRICPEETIGNNVASAAAVGMDGDQLGVPSLSLYLFCQLQYERRPSAVSLGIWDFKLGFLGVAGV